MSKELSEEEMETYREIGKIASEIREEARGMVEPGKKLLDIAEEVERRIQEEGAEPAFPCNLSLNEKAAHYTPPADDETEIEEGDLLKIDLGAHIDGYIADTATTVHVGEEKSEIVQAINQVLEKAIKMIEPGVNVGEIGAVIEKTAEKQGYSPISNLTGHSLEQWKYHGEITIPNVEKDEGKELEEGEVIAIEPFITEGEGKVENLPEAYIFKYIGKKDVSGRMALQTLKEIENNYSKLPFSDRWLIEDLSRIRVRKTLPELIASESLRPHYVLKEVEDCPVAQAENTMIVTSEGCEVTTR